MTENSNAKGAPAKRRGAHYLVPSYYLLQIKKAI